MAKKKTVKVYDFSKYIPKLKKIDIRRTPEYAKGKKKLLKRKKMYK